MQSSSSKANTESGVIRFFVERLPTHLKRMVFLASITGVANNSKEPDAVFINKLNTILNLSDSGDSALKLPIYVSGIIWKHKECILADLEILKDPTVDQLKKKECISRIETHTSYWLKYADSDTIMQDMCKLFNPNNELFKNSTLTP